MTVLRRYSDLPVLVCECWHFLFGGIRIIRVSAGDEFRLQQWGVAILFLDFSLLRKKAVPLFGTAFLFL